VISYFKSLLTIVWLRYEKVPTTTQVLGIESVEGMLGIKYSAMLWPSVLLLLHVGKGGLAYDRGVYLENLPRAAPIR
jgi:hypothetical protein